MIILSVFKLMPSVPMPSYGTSLSNCFDLGFYPTNNFVSLYTAENKKLDQRIVENSILISPGDRVLVPTGIILKLKESVSVETFADITREHDELQQYSIRLHARSGLALKKGLILANSEGIVDVDYQEEIFVLMTNISNSIAKITIGDRIAQAEVVVNEKVQFVSVNKQPTQYSERSGGFGSTGITL